MECLPASNETLQLYLSGQWKVGAPIGTTRPALTKFQHTQCCLIEECKAECRELYRAGELESENNINARSATVSGLDSTMPQFVSGVHIRPCRQTPIGGNRTTPELNPQQKLKPKGSPSTRKQTGSCVPTDTSGSSDSSTHRSRVQLFISHEEHYIYPFLKDCVPFVLRASLSHGDFAFFYDGRLVLLVERKDTADFAQSIRTQHWQKQRARLRTLPLSPTQLQLLIEEKVHGDLTTALTVHNGQNCDGTSETSSRFCSESPGRCRSIKFADSAACVSLCADEKRNVKACHTSEHSTHLRDGIAVTRSVGPLGTVLHLLGYLKVLFLYGAPGILPASDLNVASVASTNRGSQGALAEAEVVPSIPCPKPVIPAPFQPSGELPYPPGQFLATVVGTARNSSFYRGLGVLKHCSSIRELIICLDALPSYDERVTFLKKLPFPSKSEVTGSYGVRQATAKRAIMSTGTVQGTDSSRPRKKMKRTLLGERSVSHCPVASSCGEFMLHFYQKYFTSRVQQEVDDAEALHHSTIISGALQQLIRDLDARHLATISSLRGELQAREAALQSLRDQLQNCEATLETTRQKLTSTQQKLDLQYMLLEKLSATGDVDTQCLLAKADQILKELDDVEAT